MPSDPASNGIEAKHQPPFALHDELDDQQVTDLLNPKDCCILVPVQSSIELDCERALSRLESLGYTVRRATGFSQIDVGRNVMATEAMHDGFAETMWIDSDIVFQPEDVEKLRRHNLPISCGLYPKKGKRELASHVLPGTPRIVFGGRAELTEIQYAAAGFLHVRKVVYETMAAKLSLPTCSLGHELPMVPYFQPMLCDTEQGKWYLGEDFAFCERARQCDFSIIADPAIRLCHVGKYSYSWEDAGSQLERFANYDLNINDKSQ